jgi:uncharacterized membrane protein
MNGEWIALGGLMIELFAAIAVSFHALYALTCIVRREGSDKARRVKAEGVLWGLGFMVAGTLLTTLALQSWAQIRTFAVILTLRTLLKKVFSSERAAIEAHHGLRECGNQQLV